MIVSGQFQRDRQPSGHRRQRPQLLAEMGPKGQRGPGVVGEGEESDHLRATAAKTPIRRGNVQNVRGERDWLRGFRLGFGRWLDLFQNNTVILYLL